MNTGFGIIWDYVPEPQPINLNAQNHWRELHQYKFSSPRKCSEFYFDWKSRIKTLGLNCECAEEWDKLEINYPPDFSSAEAFFIWGWARHNDVNQRLLKLPISLEEAKKIHDFTTPN